MYISVREAIIIDVPVVNGPTAYDLSTFKPVSFNSILFFVESKRNRHLLKTGNKDSGEGRRCNKLVECFCRVAQEVNNKS